MVPTRTLNNGVEIPVLGFGVFQVPPGEVYEPVVTAIQAGYRLIDTAAIYGNEVGVGRAIADAGIARDDLFVTTKLWNSDQGRGGVLRAFDQSLERLGLDVVDLYLIHWPTPGRDLYVETWKTLEKIHSEGRVRAIGVSNFQEHHLRRLFDETGTVPAVNQVELHPRLAQVPLRRFHDEHAVATEAWSPIGQGQGLLDDPAVVAVADRVERTPAQVVLRWHYQQGIITIPKSVTPERIRSNIQIFDFELDEAAMATLSGLDSGGRIGPDPDNFNLA